MASIHPTASVSRDVELADDVQIGPYCVITGRVRLGEGVRLFGNNYIQGPTTIGAGTVVYPFACIGFEPQDVKFKPGMETPGVQIGRECMIREHATIHAASRPEHPTILGDRVFMMVSTHVAHDCIIGNRVTFVNGAGIAGHGEIADDVTLGGNAVIHQFCRIGRMVDDVGGLRGVAGRAAVLHGERAEPDRRAEPGGAAAVGDGAGAHHGVAEGVPGRAAGPDAAVRGDPDFAGARGRGVRR